MSGQQSPDYERGCAGCRGPLRLVVGGTLYTCDTPGCGGNISHFDRPIPSEVGAP